MNIVITRRYAVDIPDGINIFIYSLANEFMKMGHSVSIVSSVTPDILKVKSLYKFEYYPDFYSLNLKLSSSNLLSLYRWITRGKKVINNLKPDLVIINGIIPIKFNGFTVGVSHDLEKRLRPYFLQKIFKRFAYKKVHQIVATTTELRTALSKELGILIDDIEVIPTCFDIESYKYTPLAERENAIIHMGTISYKNPTTSILAFNELNKIRNGVKLYVTGSITTALTELISSLPEKCRNNIFLEGHASSDRLRYLLSHVKIASIPSIYDIPVASPSVIEPLCCGTPVVVSESISRDVVENMKEGFVISANNIQEYAHAYEKLLNDSHLWNNMSEACLKRSRLFSANSVAKKFLDMCLKKNNA